MVYLINHMEVIEFEHMFNHYAHLGRFRYPVYESADMCLMILNMSVLGLITGIDEACICRQSRYDKTFQFFLCKQNITLIFSLNQLLVNKKFPVFNLN